MKHRLYALLLGLLLALAFPALAAVGIPVTFFTAQTSNATSSTLYWPGGTGDFEVIGTFGAGTVQLQFLGADGATWLSIGAAVSAAGLTSFTLPPGSVRVVIAGATSPSLTVVAYQVPTSII